MSSEKIRPLALGVPRRKDEVFLAELYDPNNDERFYRPVGGGVEFGEYSSDTIVREFQEELNLSVEVDEYLGIVENVFTFAGTSGHEIVLIYEITITDDLGETSQVKGHDDGGVTFTAEWKSLAVFEQAETPLYPEGLLRLLTEDTMHVLP